MSKIKKIKGPRKLKVRSPRNSYCSISLEDLDWSNWWEDGCWGKNRQVYLHVHHKHYSTKGNGWEGTIHRVFCRFGTRNRIALLDGELYWLID